MRNHQVRPTDPPSTTRQRPLRTPGHALAVGILAVGLLGVLAGCQWLAARQERHGELRRLARAVGSHRVITPRLTGGFRHGPCAPDEAMVCARGSHGVVTDRLLRVSARLRRAPSRDSSGTRHIAGVFALLWPELDGSVERGVADLRAAATESPGRGAVLSDLAAALLVWAEVGRDPGALVEAYATVDSALALEPSRPEALFNRALALERLYLRHDAAEAWREYLRSDAGSEWAREARQRLERLTQSPPGWRDVQPAFRQALARGDQAEVDTATRRFASSVRLEFDRTLGQWAAAAPPAGAEADSALQRAGGLAHALERATGDPLPAQTVAVIARAAARGDRATLRRLAAGHRALQQGRERLDVQRLDLAGARERLTLALDLLSGARSPAAWWARHSLAVVWYQHHDARSYASALSLFRQVLAEAPPAYSALRAEAGRMVGLIHTIQAEYDPALDALDPAIVDALRAGERELALMLRTWRSDLVAALRGEAAGWSELYAALSLVPELPDAHRQHYTLYGSAARALHQEPLLALRFQSEALRAAGAMSNAVAVVGALRDRARLLAAMRAPARAAGDLDSAEAHARLIAGDSIRLIQLAGVDLVRGELLAASQPDHGLAALRRAVAVYRRSANNAALARVNLAIAGAHLSAGRPDSAQRAFDAALGEIERRRSTVRDYQERASLVDQARPVLDAIIRFHLDHGEAHQAFDLFERSRSRVLFEQLRGNGGRPLALAEIRRALPLRVAVISYTVLPDEVLIWVTRHDTVQLVRQRVPAAQIAGLADGLHRAITSGAATGFHGPAERLYQLVVEPVVQTVSPDDRIVFVPDKWLHLVPFAALRSAASGRYLVERHEIVIAPSASHFVAARARQRARSWADASVLAIGNPTLNPLVIPLPPLPAALVEAQRVADGYASSALLGGADASKTAFLARAPGFDVLHFAGHAVVRPEAPQLSYLALASDAPGGAGGPLYAGEIANLDLEGTRLAVLSGCHTAGGRLSDTEGPSSLARSFFAAGVPTVIASLWAVEDQSTAAFFEAYHGRLRQVQDPVAALRATQRQWISAPPVPGSAATWAAFQVFGGSERTARRPSEESRP